MGRLWEYSFWIRSDGVNLRLHNEDRPAQYAMCTACDIIREKRHQHPVCASLVLQQMKGLSSVAIGSVIIVTRVWSGQSASFQRI